MSEIKHLTIEEVNILYDEILKLRAALAERDEEIAGLKKMLTNLPTGDTL